MTDCGHLGAATRMIDVSIETTRSSLYLAGDDEPDVQLRLGSAAPERQGQYSRAQQRVR